MKLSLTSRLGFVSFFALALQAGVVEDVRTALAAGDLRRGAAIAQAFRSHYGSTPEYAEAVSWLGRGALAAKRYDEAIRFAEEARGAVESLTKARPLDVDPRLATAMGASIEVRSQAMAARGERDQAVAFLRTELKRWYATSIRARVQKNLHVLTLEGKPAPPLEGVPLLAGKPRIIFLWAHWCPDCKAEAGVLARVRQTYGDRITMVAPTQLYGYGGGGEDAKPAEETGYIRAVWARYYGALAGTPTPINNENFARYGVSTTPTIVLVDARGIVRLYHPGSMTYEELAPYLDRSLQRGGGPKAQDGVVRVRPVQKAR